MSSLPAFAQLTVTKIQDLDFGNFTPIGTGGTITITSSGTRSASANIVLYPNPIATQAIFRVNAGSKFRTVTSITKPSSVTLTRVGGGGTMRLVLGTPSPNPQFTISKNQSKNVSIGGTLTVGSIITNPSGDYSGSFLLTFNYN